ncbi:hypothetical protein ACSQ6I_12025 [Anabaena sp. WFMT]|uniref:hypothetical protein n=1 Tax=Anabaena sp. WFMT TaxID=3449730 RepID=UPI003F1E5310
MKDTVGGRRDPYYDNAINHPISRQKEPASLHDLKKSVETLRILYDEAKQLAKKMRKLHPNLFMFNKKFKHTKSRLMS